MKPTIGRIVHYNSDVGPTAAIVTFVHSNGSTVNLQIFRSNGSLQHLIAVEPGDHLGGWSWPPRV